MKTTKRILLVFILCVTIAFPAISVTALATEQQYRSIPVELFRASEFSDGVAWVAFDDYSSNKKMVGLLTTSGEIIKNNFLSSLDYQREFGSPFSGGYSYYNFRETASYKPKGFYIVNALGQMVSSSPDDDTRYEVLAGGDGLFLVQQEIQNMTTNESRMGIFCADGTWLIEPSTKMPLYELYQMKQQYGHELSFYYLGEHIFAGIYNAAFEDTLIVFNVDTQESSRLMDGWIVLTDEAENPFQFYDGLGCVISSEYVYSIGLNCMLTPVKSVPKRYDLRYIPYHDGIFLLGTDENYGCCDQTVYGGVFYNLHGETVLDFSQYDLAIGKGAIGFYEFRDNCAAVKIHGADHEMYLSHIRMDGSFNYEPIKIDSNMAGCYGNGNALGTAIYYRPYNDYSDKIVTQDGRISTLPDFFFINLSVTEIKMGFYDGIVLYTRSGKIYYIDENGNTLTTFIKVPIAS